MAVVLDKRRPPRTPPMELHKQANNVDLTSDGCTSLTVVRELWVRVFLLLLLLFFLRRFVQAG